MVVAKVIQLALMVEMPQSIPAVEEVVEQVQYNIQMVVVALQE